MDSNTVKLENKVMCGIKKLNNQPNHALKLPEEIIISGIKLNYVCCHSLTKSDEDYCSFAIYTNEKVYCGYKK